MGKNGYREAMEHKAIGSVRQETGKRFLDLLPSLNFDACFHIT